MQHKRRQNRGGKRRPPPTTRSSLVKTVLEPTRNPNRLVILTEPGRFCPDRLYCKLVFTDPIMSRGQIGEDVANWYYQSSIFNPDPSNPGEQLPGLAELANLYSHYRVHSMKAQIEMYNQNSEATILAIWPSTVGQNVNSLTHEDILEFSSNPNCKSKMCGSQQGMGRVRINALASAKKLIGPEFATENDYSALVGADPVNMYKLNVGLCNCVGDFTYNAVFRTRIVYEVEFFTLRQLKS